MGESTSNMSSDERACPWCAETVKTKAVVCKHCKRDITTEEAQKSSVASAKKSVPNESPITVSQTPSGSLNRIWGIILVSVGGLSLITGSFGSVLGFIIFVLVPASFGIWLLIKAKKQSSESTSSTVEKISSVGVNTQSEIAVKAANLYKAGVTSSKKLLSQKKNIYLLVSAFVAVFLLIVGLTVKANFDEQARVAAAALLAEEQKVEEAKQDLIRESKTGKELIENAQNRYDESVGWSNDTDRASLLAAVEVAQKALKSNKYSTISSANAKLLAAFNKVGTLAEAQAAAEKAAEAARDEQYKALVTANGRPGWAETAGTGRSQCAGIKENKYVNTNDPTALAIHWIENPDRQVYEAVQVYCPEYQPAVDIAKTGFKDGTKVIGKNIPAGTYRTVKGVSDCYWERNNGSGDIIDNNFITAAPNGVEVRVNDGEALVTRGCGVWIMVG
ncbi:hypothetical protein AURMO_00707 [Aurantimicrobium photophilum]|uniref:Uncharacterized protein n=1 Tax=Aurantimicrobium photophilum TaxID=1987356 RepID=A0A2Z3RZE2_9MICO|nr:hypothetical protein AURMO_00707 [Aurantimicrobium photophilum]